jgi:hypothetical protein
MAAHLIEEISFAEGLVWCSCGLIVEGRRPQELADAYATHRREAGARPVSVGASVGWRSLPFVRAAESRA